jgi:hypothetical protein
LEVLVDAASLPLLDGGWCNLSAAPAGAPAALDRAYVALWSPAAKQTRPLRRLIMGLAVDPAHPDEVLNVGHRNDDPLDCRRANLVVGTVAQRCYRKRKVLSVNGKPVSSEYKGVSWSKGGKRWMAMIHCGGKARYLGLHAREEDAALAYDRAARELFGEHARLNFPGPADELGKPTDKPVRRDAA